MSKGTRSVDGITRDQCVSDSGRPKPRGSLLKASAYWLAARSAAVLILSACGSLRAADPPKVPAPASDGAKPFFSRCVEKAYRKSTEYTELPDKGAASPLWYDIPFAVHVPVEVPYEGGTVRITMTGSVTWDNPPKEWTSSSNWGEITGWTAGIYKTDGQELPPDSVFSQFHIQREARSPGDKIEFAKDNPVPTFFKSQRVTLGNATKGHVPFSKDATHYSYILAPTKPGWYVVWFAVDLSTMWPEKSPKCEEIKGKLHLDTVVTRSERVLIQNDYDYMFKRSPKPAQISDDKLFKTASHEVPFTLKRNGWVLESAEIQNLEKWVEQKRVTREGRDYDVEVDAKPGPPVALAVRLSEWGAAVAGSSPAQTPALPDGFNPKTRSLTAPPPTTNAQAATITAKETFQWNFELPAQIPDHSFCVVKVGGGTERWVNRDHPLYKDTPPGKEPQLPLRVRWQPMTTEGTKFNAVATGIYTDKKRSNAETAKKEFAEKYGEEALNWWIEDYREEVFDGPKKGGEPFKYLAHGVPPLWERDVLTGKKAGALPIISFEAGPWKVLGHYRRLSDSAERSGSTTTAGPTKTVVEKDPFWTKWFEGYAKFEEEQARVAMAADLNAGAQALALRVALRRHRLLMNTLHHELEEQGGNQELRVLLHQATASISKLKELAGVQSAIIQEQRQKIEASAAEAKGAYEAIVKKLDEGWKDYGDRHFEIRLKRQEWQDKADTVGIQIMRKVGDPELVRKYLDEIGPVALSAASQLLRAEMLREEGNPLEALEALRSAATIAPDDREVQMRLIEGECVFLQMTKEKSQDAVRQTRAAFYKYMLERGFPMEKTAEQRKAEEEAAKAKKQAEETSTLWWVWGQLPDIDSEAAWNRFTTGLFGSVAGIMGKQDALAEILSTKEIESTKCYLGLETLIRLRQRGYPLLKPDRDPPPLAGRPPPKPWIGAMTSQQLIAAAQENYTYGDGKLFTEANAQEVVRCIKLAMQLPEVDALMKGDRLALKLGVEKRYWNQYEIGDTWAEYIGDITSVQNLIFMFLPLATAGKVPGAIYWGAEELWQLEKARQFGHVITGSEAAARMLGWQKLVSTLGKWERGREAALSLLKVYEEHHRAKEWWEKGARLGLVDKGIWGVWQLVAMTYLQYHVSEWAKERGGPAAALAADFLMFFSTDTEALSKFLKESRMSPAAIKGLEKVMKDRITQIQTSSRHLRETLQLTDDMGKVLAKMREGKLLTPEEIRLFERESARYWQVRPPTPHPAHNLRIACDAAAEAARNGVDNGAAECAARMKARALLEEKELLEAEAAAKKVEAALKSAQGEGAVPPADGAGAGPAIVPAPQKGPVTLVVGPVVMQKDGRMVYPKPRPPLQGSLSSQAEVALLAEDFEKAEELFEKAKKKILKSGALPEEYPLDKVEAKLGQIEELKAAAKKAAAPKINQSNPGEEISQETLDDIINEFSPHTGDHGPWEATGHKGNFGTMHRKKNSGFIIKEMDVNVVQQLEGETIARAFCKALGIDSPAFKLHIIYDAQGNIKKAYVVYRRVMGPRLDEAPLTMADIFNLRKDLSKMRAVSLVLGDHDRKLDNFMVHMNGRVFMIDHGMVDIRGVNSPFDNLPPAAEVRMEGAYGLDHWYSRSTKDDINMIMNKRSPSDAPKRELLGDGEWATFFRKQILMEEALSYDAAKETIEAIEKLVADKPKLKELLREVYVSVHLSPKRIEVAGADFIALKKSEGKFVEEGGKLIDKTGEIMKPGDVLDIALVHKEMERRLNSRIEKYVETSVATLEARTKDGRLHKAMKRLDERRGAPPGTAALHPKLNFYVVMGRHAELTLQHVALIPEQRALARLASPRACESLDLALAA